MPEMMRRCGVSSSSSGLLERRGSPASLTIELLSSSTPSSFITNQKTRSLIPNNSSSSSSGNHITTSNNRRRRRHPILIIQKRRPLFLSGGGSPLPKCMSQNSLTSASNRLSRSALRFPSTYTLKDRFQEFIGIPLNHPGKLDLPGCSSKNRYQSIWPNPISRVHLRPPSTTALPPSVDENDNDNIDQKPSFECFNSNNNNDDPSTRYINANYVRSYDSEDNGFIATQGPLSNTIDDFWQMVWQEDSPIIVQMTKLVERNKVKCEAYIPHHNPSASSPGVVDSWYGQIKVIVKNIIAQNGYWVRDIILQKQEEYKHIRHYWFTGWPDQKAPKSTAIQMLNMMKQIRQDQTRFKTMMLGNRGKGPIVVHCSAGIGRTGCFIGSWIGMRQLCEENSVDILGIVSQMRLDRGGMIQTPEQYEFLHHILTLFESEEMAPPTMESSPSLSSSSGTNTPADGSRSPSSTMIMSLSPTEENGGSADYSSKNMILNANL